MHALILDFDGVIIDSEPLHGRVLEELCSRHGMKVPHNHHVGLSDDQAIRLVFEHNNRPWDQQIAGQLMHDKLQVVRELLAGGRAPLYPGVRELITRAAASVPVAVCSAARRDEIATVLEAVDLATHFRAIISADDVQRSKPDPSCYQLACHRVEQPPDQCLVIEDSPPGVESAVRAGCHVIAVEHTTARRHLARAHRFARCIADIELSDYFPVTE